MRYYNINLGRFNQKDFYRSYNNYIYSFNNPLNRIDPFGLMPPWLWHWIQLRMMPPGGGGGFSASCDNPGWSADCYFYCASKSNCEACCALLYGPNYENDPGYDQCKSGCK